MRVGVDRSICQGHALCVGQAPDLFDLDEVEGRAFTLADSVPPAQEDDARNAAMSCPERAISVD
jgi:ferredoxin